MKSKQKNKKTLSKKFLKKQLRKSRLELELLENLKNDFRNALNFEVEKNNDLVDRIDTDSIKINGLNNLLQIKTESNDYLESQVRFLHKQVLFYVEMLGKSIENVNELKVENKALNKELIKTLQERPLQEQSSKQEQPLQEQSSKQEQSLQDCKCSFITGCLLQKSL